MAIQIDVININNKSKIVFCNLYTQNRCVKMAISIEDYNLLIEDNFFIRSGKKIDSANVINTTLTYELKK